MMLFSDSESAPPPNAAAPTTDDAPKLAPAEPLHPTGAASANSPPHPDPAQTDGDNSAAPHGDKPPEAQPGKDETKALGNGTESNGKNAKAPPKEAKEKKPLERPESARKPANRVNRFKKRKKTPRRRDYGF